MMSQRKRRHVINWNKFKSIEIKKPVKNKVGESKEAIKRTIKQLYFQHILTGNETYYNAYTDWCEISVYSNGKNCHIGNGIVTRS